MSLRRPLPLHVASITDVAERQLCTGCGACAYVQPDEIAMVDDVNYGRRPVVNDARGPVSTARALDACPGVGLEHGPDPDGTVASVRASWGPVLEVWEGHAADPEIRFAGSSGGAATALALHSIESGEMHGVLHIRAREDVAYLNETVLSRSREDLVAATGSRYAPASPCDSLDLVRDAVGPCMFIGKPCDVAATFKIRKTDEQLNANLGLTVAIFCAGTPTTQGTFEMLEQMGISDPAVVENLRYRGNGWPGLARADFSDDGRTEHRAMTYDESWGKILQRHRQWRCYVCADHTGEFADIAVGDPWYREVSPDEPGLSLIVVRTERGRSFLTRAMAAGSIEACRVDADRIPASQPGLLKVRGAVWGRVLASRLTGVPAPRYTGLPTFHVWWRDLPLADKARSTLGLVRRIRRKGLRRRHPVSPMEAEPEQAASPEDQSDH